MLVNGLVSALSYSSNIGFSIEKVSTPVLAQ